MKSHFLIFGAGGNGRVILDIARSIGITVSAFVDDSPQMTKIEGVVVCLSADIGSFIPFEFIVGIGSNRVRAQLYSELIRRGTPRTVIHAFSAVSTQAQIASGVAVMPGVVVNTGTLVGDNSILNTACSVDHDCNIGPHCHICPGVHLAGSVTVGPGTMIGTGTSVIPGIKIGQNCIIGAGSTIVRDIPNHSVAFGNPARVIRENDFFLFSDHK